MPKAVFGLFERFSTFSAVTFNAVLGFVFAKEIYGARKVSLGVFKNNEPAYYCYKSVGLKDLPDTDTYEINGETWDCLELEMNLK